MPNPNDRQLLPLKGVRVLDLTRVLAGPFCTMILADLGAEVVKVERPDVGDDARAFGPFLPSGTSAYFASLNRGKKSIVLDLKNNQADRDTFLRLVERADVLVENFRPGTLERLELGVDRLKATNPQLVYVSGSGFGKSGPDAERPAYDIVIQALSGLMSITGPRPEEPVKVGTSISDLLTGLFMTIGVLAGLRRRDQHAVGAEVDIGMLDCTVAALENAICRFEVTRQVPQPLGNRHPSITPFQSFATPDGPLVIAAGNDVLWRKLCAVLGDAKLASDARFKTNSLRTQNWQELQQRIEDLLQADRRDRWLAKLTAAGIPAAPVRTIDEVMADPQLRARGMWHRMRDGEGWFTAPASPLHIDAAPLPLSDEAPALGQHTEEVLRRWLAD